jgi:hypothetical protein
MPKKLHEALERQASKKGYTGKRRAAYVYGTLNKWKKKHGK